MNYLVHILGSSLKTISLKVTEIANMNISCQQLASFESECGTHFNLAVTVPSKQSKSLIPIVNIWNLNTALLEAGLCEPDDRISAAMTEPGPVLQYCNKASKAVTLASPPKDPEGETKDDFSPQAGTVDGDSTPRVLEHEDEHLEREDAQIAI